MKVKLKNKLDAVAALCAACLCAVSASAAMSGPARMIARPDDSLHWHTYLAGSGGVEWEYPAGAASARLTVSGKGGITVHVFNRPVAAFVPAAPSEAADEDVVDLALEFFASADAAGDAIAGETLTASGIGIVRGVNGAALDFRSSSTEGREWSRVNAKTAVLPVPEDTTALTLDGEPVGPASVPGWHLWRSIPAGRECTWTLTDGETSYTAVLHSANSGFILFVR